MELNFFKYQGAGNDFVIVDARNIDNLDLHEEQIKQLCDRHLGVGADGFMTLENDNDGADFFMRYWNCDGRESTMCGNGGRCIAHFALSLGLGNDGVVRFNAVDGEHMAFFEDTDVIRLKMVDVEELLEVDSDKWLIDSGSPHYVELVEDVEQVDISAVAPTLREQYDANVNFVEERSGKIRTWERGVEGETLACGTGCVAAAIVLHNIGGAKNNITTVYTRLASLKIEFDHWSGGYRDIYLTGGAQMVFEGKIEL